MPSTELPAISTDLRDRLKDDIRQRGILVPILLSQEGECLDGKIRLEIAKELGISQALVPKVIIGRLSAAERTDLRIALNLFRRQLNQAQIRELIAWELRKVPQASDRSVGRTVGVDHKTVAGVRQRLEAGGEIPHLLSRNGSDGKCYRKPVVFTTSNAQAVEAQRLLVELGDEAPTGSMNVKKLRRMASARERADHLERMGQATSDLGDLIKLLHCDFRHIGNKLAPGSVDLLLCDPPWGGDFAPLRRAFAETISGLLKPDGIVACYTGVAHMPEFIDEFRSSGLKYEWTLVGKREVSSVRQRDLLINRWVPIVILSKGRFRAVSPLSDVLESTAKEKSLHDWQQPVDEAVTLIKALSRPGALVCDLCMGSGTTAVATIMTGEGRRFVGCETDAKLVKAARCRIRDGLNGRIEAARSVTATVAGR